MAVVERMAGEGASLGGKDAFVSQHAATGSKETDWTPQGKEHAGDSASLAKGRTHLMGVFLSTTSLRFSSVTSTSPSNSEVRSDHINGGSWIEKLMQS